MAKHKNNTKKKFIHTFVAMSRYKNKHDVIEQISKTSLSACCDLSDTLINNISKLIYVDLKNIICLGLCLPLMDQCVRFSGI